MAFTDKYGIVKRNIQQQVQKNMDDIAALKVLNNVGIKVVGTVETEDNLPAPQTYMGGYGDTFAVGAEPPYEFYVFTRPSDGDVYPHWFNIGNIQIQGPQGPQGETGPEGPQGERGATWRSRANGNPTVTPDDKTNDLYLRADNGDVFKYIEGTGWGRIGNIRGPQGIQGAQGETGPQGPQGPRGEKGQTGDSGNFIRIISKLASSDLLPNPTTLDDPSWAYLVGDSNDLYILMGASQAQQHWYNSGPINVATFVTVNGQFQSSWDADTKLDKSTIANSVYAVNASGGQTMISINSDPVARSIPIRNASGTMKANAATLGPTQFLATSNDTFVANLDQLTKYLNTDYLFLNNPCYSNVMYIPVKSAQDNRSPSLQLRINPNGDQSPMWMVTFKVGSGWASSLSFTNNNAVYWIDGQAPVFEQGKFVTIMLWPATSEHLSDYTAGGVYDGDLLGVVAYASAGA